MLCVSSVFSMSGQANDLLTCNDISCNRVAQRVEYRYDKPERSVTLKTDHFSIEIPDKPIDKIVSTKEDLMIIYGDNQLLYIAENPAPEIEGLEHEVAYRYPEILFFKTPKDVATGSDSEKLFWNTALASKPFYFKGASEVTYAENGDLTYYLSNTNELGFSSRAMVSNSVYKYRYLVIEAKQMDFNAFKQVVTSVK